MVFLGRAHLLPLLRGVSQSGLEVRKQLGVHFSCWFIFLWNIEL
jgi:hypothetical protein